MILWFIHRIGGGDPEEHRRPGFAGRRHGQHAGGTLRVRILGVFEGGRAVGATRQDKAMPGFPVKPGIALLAPARTNLRHRLRKDACCSYAGAQSHHRRRLRCGIPGRRQCAAFRRNPGYTAPAGGGSRKKSPAGRAGCGAGRPIGYPV